MRKILFSMSDQHKKKKNTKPRFSYGNTAEVKSEYMKELKMLNPPVLKKTTMTNIVMANKITVTKPLNDIVNAPSSITAVL